MTPVDEDTIYAVVTLVTPNAQLMKDSFEFENQDLDEFFRPLRLTHVNGKALEFSISKIITAVEESYHSFEDEDLIFFNGPNVRLHLHYDVVMSVWRYTLYRPIPIHSHFWRLHAKGYIGLNKDLDAFLKPFLSEPVAT